MTDITPSDTPEDQALQDLEEKKLDAADLESLDNKETPKSESPEDIVLDEALSSPEEESSENQNSETTEHMDKSSETQESSDEAEQVENPQENDLPAEQKEEKKSPSEKEDVSIDDAPSKVAGVFELDEEDQKKELEKMEKGRQPKQGRNWYAIHTYSGYEDSVEKALRQRIETLNMQDKIFDVLVPKETQIVMRRGKPVEIKKCLFPGYALVDMTVTDDSWYVVRNTPNVTGFVGSGNIPVAVTLEEFGVVQSRMGTDEPKFKSDFNSGDIVKIMKGPFATFEGKVDQVDTGKGKLTVLVTVFDRETPVELDFDQVIKK